MTPEQKRLLRETWQATAPIADAAAEMFYERLFEIDPGARPLFAGVDMAGQGEKLMQTLSAVVQGLDHLQALVPTIEDLGRRHAGYGVTEAHYASVGAALLWTLERGLGREVFTPQAKQAWSDAYGLIAEIMQRGASGAGAAAPANKDVAAV